MRSAKAHNSHPWFTHQMCLPALSCHLTQAIRDRVPRPLASRLHYCVRLTRHCIRFLSHSYYQVSGREARDDERSSFCARLSKSTQAMHISILSLVQLLLTFHVHVHILHSRLSLVHNVRCDRGVHVSTHEVLAAVAKRAERQKLCHAISAMPTSGTNRTFFVPIAAIDIGPGSIELGGETSSRIIMLTDEDLVSSENGRAAVTKRRHGQRDDGADKGIQICH